MWQYLSIETPVGKLYLVGQSGNLVQIYLPGQEPELIQSHWDESPESLGIAAGQITEYFEGKRKEFNLKTEPKLSEFQREVLNEVSKIPFGETVSYQDLANRLGNPKAVRAVGAANAKNPLPLVIPCHRVIGSTQKLVGYAGGIPLKRYLLEFESKQFNLF